MTATPDPRIEAVAKLTTLPPEAYDGEVLCERCGSDGHGRRFATCAETDPETGERYTHARACQSGRIYRGICEECKFAVFGYPA
jgi:hypothetical protein